MPVGVSLPVSSSMCVISVLKGYWISKSLDFFCSPLNNIIGILIWLVMLQKGNIQRWLHFAYWVLTLSVLVVKGIFPSLAMILLSRSLCLLFSHTQLSALCYYFLSENSKSHFSHIANLVTLQGEDQPLIRNVMTFKSCSPIVGVDVMSFDTEREVLLAWRVISLCLSMFILMKHKNFCKPHQFCSLVSSWDMLIK